MISLSNIVLYSIPGVNLIKRSHFNKKLEVSPFDDINNIEDRIKEDDLEIIIGMVVNIILVGVVFTFLLIRNFWLLGFLIYIINALVLVTLCDLAMNSNIKIKEIVKQSLGS